VPLIDLASGRTRHLNPKELVVTLTKANGALRVDTMLIDADDF
jgi:hypothetical protein